MRFDARHWSQAHDGSGVDRWCGVDGLWGGRVVGWTGGRGAILFVRLCCRPVECTNATTYVHGVPPMRHGYRRLP